MLQIICNLARTSKIDCIPTSLPEQEFYNAFQISVIRFKLGMVFRKCPFQTGKNRFHFFPNRADGVTATALLVQLLKSLGADVREYIPNRFEEGYGVNKDALTTLHEGGVKLVVTVDCGMRSAKETEHANKLGLDLIITDHHLPGDDIPRACAIINPKQTGDNYPYKELAGVGLAYKLAGALCQSFDMHPTQVEADWTWLPSVQWLTWRL